MKTEMQEFILLFILCHDCCKHTDSKNIIGRGYADSALSFCFLLLRSISCMFYFIFQWDVFLVPFALASCFKSCLQVEQDIFQVYS